MQSGGIELYESTSVNKKKVFKMQDYKKKRKALRDL